MITATNPQALEAEPITVRDAWEQFKQFAIGYYPRGPHDGEIVNIGHAMSPLLFLFGSEPIDAFGPKKLKAIQALLIQGYTDNDGKELKPLSRKVINSRINRIKRVVRWAVSEELAPPSLAHGLDTVAALKRGRTVAREAKRIMPVSAELVDATLPLLPAIVADMVRFQQLTGCRPGEVETIRPGEVDQSGEVWLYKPSAHKTSHHDKDRVIYIGPQAQAILRPYLAGLPNGYCFSPQDTDNRRLETLRAKRKTKVQPSQVDRSKPNAKRKPGERYNRRSYANAIRRACLKGGLEHWAPNQLRHSAATAVRKAFGLESAQVFLGHSQADVTQIYAERNETLAIEVAKKLG